MYLHVETFPENPLLKVGCFLNLRIS